MDGALAVDDLEDLVRETEEFQGRITEAVQTYARTTRSKTITPPDFEPSPKLASLAPGVDTATQRAFQTANYPSTRPGPRGYAPTNIAAAAPCAPRRTRHRG